MLLFNVIDPGAKDNQRVNNKIYGYDYGEINVLPRQLIQQSKIYKKTISSLY
jgi:hypothetical protein